MGTRNPPIAFLAVALSLLGAAPAAAGAADAFDGAGSSAFHLEISPSVGGSYAREGRHGGLQLGILSAVETRGWIGGIQFSGIFEFEGMPPNTYQPLEHYRYLGGFAGRRLRYRALSMTLGLGGGVLDGKRRTRFLREYTNCGFRFFGCREEDEKLYREYDSEEFTEAAFNPLVRTDVRISRHFALGFLGQAYVTGQQGLWTIAPFLAFRY